MGSVVIDIGQNLVKAGYSSEDSPRISETSRVGLVEKDGQKKVLVGPVKMSHTVRGLEIKTPLENSVIHDFDAYDALLGECLGTLRSEEMDLPVILAESTFVANESREYKLNAVYLAKDSVLSAFASGRATALVVDCGAGSTRVVPVVDGYALKSASVSQNFGGDLLTLESLRILRDDLKIDLACSFQVSSRKQVQLNTKPSYQFKDVPVSESFLEYSRFKMAQDFKESLCQVSEQPFNASDLSVKPLKFYEFPTGFNSSFSAERFKIPEIIFNPKLVNEQFIGLAEMVEKSVSLCDSELRQNLLSNVYLCGGTSLMPGFVERLQYDLSRFFPVGRVRLGPTSNSVERKYAAFFGGSVLGSVSMFHKMWMTKQEYEEHGAGYIQKKCS